MFPTNSLTTGKNNPLLPELIQAIYHADSIMIASAFVQMTGLNLLRESLLDALESGKSITIITSDYLDITDPNALRYLMTLTKLGAKVKLFETGNSISFHVKAYVFTESNSGQGCAYVGSSNISKSALLDGYEWNARVSTETDALTFEKLLSEFRDVEIDPRCVNLTHELIDEYIKRRKSQETSSQIDNETPTPHIFQAEALRELSRARLRGWKKGLVVLATGLGKTWLAAFDVKATEAKRILFVAHREEILNQAEATFSNLLPEKRSGRFSADRKDFSAEILFASVQSLGKTSYLREFSQSYFDYIIIDEFHHAAASTYVKVIDHFRPEFLLGLTATPDRTDSKDILTLCDNHEIYRRTLFDGIKKKLLSPFTYRGIAEHESVNYGEIPWRNGRFDPDELTARFATLSRAEHNFRNWREYKQDKTLAFCVSIKHSDFLAEFFSRKGVKCLSLHSHSTVQRGEAIELLRQGKIEIIFTVDLFNEGVDIPEVNTILMLRPTESTILFLQQLGRGLRTTEKKSHLEIIDFIGNHISFFKKPEALFDIAATGAARKGFLSDIEEDTLLLPDNCFVNYEPKAIDFMKALISTKPDLQYEQYLNLKEQLGKRPTLTEFWSSKGNVNTIRTGFGSWFEFLAEINELNDQEAEVVEAHSAFLKEIETTSRQKSFKFITLKSLLALGVNQSHSFQNLANTSYTLLRDTDFWESDVPERFKENVDGSTPEGWVTYWRKNPIEAWASSEAFFEADEQEFGLGFPIGADTQECFCNFLDEMIDYRLQEYRTTVEVNTVKPEIPILHKEFMRADIPPLFGHEFSEAIWNSGFVTPKGYKDIYLLVTLDKTGKASEHQYTDYFADARTLHWQSQNSNEPDKGKGKRLVTHESDGSVVYLFVRKQGKIRGGTAAPFFCCGPVTYITHEGSKPMSVKWRLTNPLPQGLFDIFRS